MTESLYGALFRIEHHGGKPRAVGESGVADGHDRVGDGHGSEAGAVGESLIAD